MTAEHTAIGNSNNYFEGTYDGANLTITGLTINKPYSDYQALFGYVSSATIKNVKLVNCNITGDQCIGGIVGRASGSSSSKSNIENCHVSGTIAAITTDAEGHGGIPMQKDMVASLAALIMQPLRDVRLQVRCPPQWKINSMVAS